METFFGILKAIVLILAILTFVEIGLHLGEGVRIWHKPEEEEAHNRKSRILIVVFLSIMLSLFALEAFAEVTSDEDAWLTANEGKQDDRQKIIDGLIHEGVFAKAPVVEAPVADLWIAGAWYEIPYDAKKDFAGVAWTYLLTVNRKVEVLRIRDNLTGKTIGTYSDLGLRLD